MNKKLKTVKSLKVDFCLKILFPAQAIKISSVLVPVYWNCYIHTQKSCQMVLLPHCCKQKDTYTFSEYLDKLMYGKISLFSDG